jgi:hypothetical protein
MSDCEFDFDPDLDLEFAQPLTFTGRIYQVVCVDEPELYSVGSTKQSLRNRMAYHLQDAVKGKCKMYRIMRERGLQNWAIRLLDEVQVASVDELRVIEQDYIKLLKPPLNTQAAYSSPEDRAAKKREWNKLHRNKESGTQCSAGMQRMRSRN